MIEKAKLTKLYQSGLSMQEISDRTGWSYKQVVYWMEKYEIPRRSRSEATYQKRNPQGDPFKIKRKLNAKEMFLRGMGLGLYWGEGDKSINGTAIRVGNTDPYLIQQFRKFLRDICGVKEHKIKYALTLFNDCNEKEAIKFWENHLGVKKKQLGKIIKIAPQGKGTYKKKNKYGVFTIIVSNTKLRNYILREIELT